MIGEPTLREIFESSVSRSLDAREIELGESHLIVSARPLDSGGSVVTLLDVTEIRRLEQVREDFVANASHAREHAVRLDGTSNNRTSAEVIADGAQAG